MMTSMFVLSLLSSASAFRVGQINMMSAPKPVKVGLVGGGTVGGGIVEILSRKAAFASRLRRRPADGKGRRRRDPNKPRDWTVPAGCEITSDVSDVVDDPTIDIVVEVMGGTTSLRRW